MIAGMAFAFHDRRGHVEWMMRLAGWIAGAVALCGVAQAQDQSEPSHVLAGLTGFCWTAQLQDDVTDTHCFSEAVGGYLVMDVHKVRSGPHGVVYEGVTVYRTDRDNGRVRWDYYNSGGQLMQGFAVRAGDTIRFPATDEQPAELTWKLTPEAYETSSTAPGSERSRFVKAGPAPEGGF
jgi:hypothetical protein